MSAGSHRGYQVKVWMMKGLLVEFIEDLNVDLLTTPSPVGQNLDGLGADSHRGSQELGCQVFQKSYAKEWVRVMLNRSRCSLVVV